MGGFIPVLVQVPKTIDKENLEKLSYVWNDLDHPIIVASTFIYVRKRKFH